MTSHHTGFKTGKRRNPNCGIIRGMNMDEFRHKIGCTARCIATVAFLATALPAVLFHWIALVHGAPEILSGRFFSSYNWNAICGGGAFDQSGLTRMMIVVFFLETFAVLGRNLFVMLSSRRKWSICVNALFIVALVLPFVTAIFCSWELCRYIAVMGITNKRIIGVRYLILFMSIPMFCTLRWVIGTFSTRKIALMAVGCLLAAFTTFLAIDTAARRSVAAHPRPAWCWPNHVGVPDKAETATDYGLKELFFGVSTRKKGFHLKTGRHNGTNRKSADTPFSGSSSYRNNRQRKDNFRYPLGLESYIKPGNTSRDMLP